MSGISISRLGIIRNPPNLARSFNPVDSTRHVTLSASLTADTSNRDDDGTLCTGYRVLKSGRYPREHLRTSHILFDCRDEFFHLFGRYRVGVVCTRQEEQAPIRLSLIKSCLVCSSLQQHLQIVYRFSSPMTTSRFRRPISASTITTLLPKEARAAPRLARWVLAPPLPEAITIAWLNAILPSVPPLVQLPDPS